MQHLPAGDYWTSLNADIHNSSKKLKDLSLGHAELAAVFPVPSTSSSTTPVPTLGSYHVNKPSAGQLPEHRQVSTGSFLDYGMWASFAPSFDHSGEVVGRSEIGELLYRREQRKRAREEWKRERSEGTGNVMEVDEETPNEPKNGQVQLVDIDAQLEGLLPSDQVETLKDALSCLNLERAVNELLERNCRALQRLEELQKVRLSKPDSGSNPVEEGSEEWETGLFHHKFSIMHMSHPRLSSPCYSDFFDSPGIIEATIICNRRTFDRPARSRTRKTRANPCETTYSGLVWHTAFYENDSLARRCNSQSSAWRHNTCSDHKCGSRDDYSRTNNAVRRI